MNRMMMMKRRRKKMTIPNLQPRDSMNEKCQNRSATHPENSPRYQRNKKGSSISRSQSMNNWENWATANPQTQNRTKNKKKPTTRCPFRPSTPANSKPSKNNSPKAWRASMNLSAISTDPPNQKSSKECSQNRRATCSPWGPASASWMQNTKTSSNPTSSPLNH